MDFLFLSKTNLFRGTSPDEVEKMLQCLGAQERAYKKGNRIYRTGDHVDSMGMILSGSVHIEYDDFWGNKSILNHIGPGQIFAETYACVPEEPLMVNVIARENSRILFLNAAHILTTCPNACPFHNKVLRNLLAVTAQKNLNLSRRAQFTSPKSIRGRLLTYLSYEATKQGSCEFTIPFNRQQLADYLGVDRSALSNELSKMQRDGLLSVKRNAFVMRNNHF